MLIERIVRLIATLIAWIALPALMAIGLLRVLDRHLRWGMPLDTTEIGVALFFGLVMVSLGYAMTHDAHVRIDAWSRRLSARQSAWLELAAALVVVTPFCLVLIAFGVESAVQAFHQGERLGDGDLALRWLVRAMLPLGFALLLLATIAFAWRRWRETRT